METGHIIEKSFYEIKQGEIISYKFQSGGVT
jgi:hypothetical protein